MSATIDSPVFANYFRSSEGLAPVVDIPGRSFEVKEVHLGDLGRYGNVLNM